MTKIRKLLDSILGLKPKMFSPLTPKLMGKGVPKPPSYPLRVVGRATLNQFLHTIVFLFLK